MASSKDRQRKLARAKVERQMARRAARARRNRQVQAGVAVGVVVLLVVLGTVWGLGGFSSKPKKTTASATCAWTPASTTGNPDLKDVGTPPTSGMQTAGSETLTMTTNQGVITALLGADKSPCTVASMRYLAGKQFFNSTNCYRVTAAPPAVYCGDPSGTGNGGPGYTFATEYTPATAATAAATPPATASAKASGTPSAAASGSASASPSAAASPTPSTTEVVYPRGTIAMAGNGQPDTNGSKFFILTKDTPLPPQYTAFGTVTQGMNIIDKIVAAGAVGTNGKPAADGKPKTTLTIQSLAVSPGAASAPATAPTPTATPTSSPAASASAKS